MKGLWYRILLLWYRITGSSSVQAEWRAREAVKAPSEARREMVGQATRALDRRFHCVCGQLLVVGDRRCSRCGRLQFMPYWLRGFGRLARGVLPEHNLGVYLIGALIALGYLVQIRFGGGGTGSLESGSAYYQLGASIPSVTLTAQPWRAFTYTCLHGGLMHLIFNSVVLIQIGPLVERAFGTARFLFAWCFTGAAAAILPAFFGFDRLVIGASGSIFGLLGMAMLFGHKLGTSQGKRLRDEMIKWTVISTLFGFMVSGVAHDAHFAGLAAGLLVALVLPPPHAQPSRKRMSPILGTIAIAWMAYSILALSGWMKAGQPVSDALPEQAKTMILLDKMRNEGPSAVFDETGIALLDRACSRQDGTMREAETERLLIEALKYAKGLDPSLNLLFRKTVGDCVYRDRDRLDRGR
ncbi:MAG: rhomboid family intramembrane serine protease [Myxococcota bacterium]|nr:rhomboid family intramembrane serine protease [Myxococcota bacterium]